MKQPPVDSKDLSDGQGRLWPHERNVKCVVLCAGKGERISPALGHLPKVLVPVWDQPILTIVVDYWRQFTEDFVFVVGYRREQVIEFAQQLPINAEFVVQTELRGIGHAVSLTRDVASTKFIVVLGDCLCKGSFAFPDDMVQGVGVQRTADRAQISRNFMVEIDSGRIVRAIEKPENPTVDLCGLGFYFFDSRVFDYIERTPPSALRGEVEITDVIGAGRATLQIEVIGHRRNSHGPFHLSEKWPKWTGPAEFQAGGDAWFEGYQLVPCGLMAPPKRITRR